MLFILGMVGLMQGGDRDAKRIWFWRYAPLISTGIVCFFFGGVLSEVVQSLLPVSCILFLTDAHANSR